MRSGAPAPPPGEPIVPAPPRAALSRKVAPVTWSVPALKIAPPAAAPDRPTADGSGDVPGRARLSAGPPAPPRPPRSAGSARPARRAGVAAGAGGALASAAFAAGLAGEGADRHAAAPARRLVGDEHRVDDVERPGVVDRAAGAVPPVPPVAREPRCAAAPAVAAGRPHAAVLA